MIPSLDAGLQTFRLSAKLAFPFGSSFYLSIYSFCLHPASCLARSKGGLTLSVGSWLVVSWAFGAQGCPPG